MPDASTVDRVYDNLDFLRGVEVFLNFIPLTSVEGIRMGMEEVGATKSNQCLIFENLMDSNPLFLTGNTDTVYCSVILDLKRDGATVVEIPPKCGPSTETRTWGTSSMTVPRRRVCATASTRLPCASSKPRTS